VKEITLAALVSIGVVFAISPMWGVIYKIFLNDLVIETCREVEDGKESD
jgi:hypothetical protein